MSHFAVTARKDGLLAEVRQCPLCRSADLAEAFRVKVCQYVRCRGCGLIFREGIDSLEERARYETDVDLPLAHHHRLGLRKAVFENSLQEIGRAKNVGRLLDVGCGNGQFLDLARKRGWETYGVELSPMACAQARDVLDLNVICGQLSDAKFADAFFDVVTLYDVLCHLPSPLDELTEVRRILKVDGLLVLRIRNAAFHVGLLQIAGALEPYLVFHLFCFTPRTIRHVLRKAGYTWISVRNAAPTPFDPYSVSPLGGDRGMQAIKSGVHLAVEGLYHLSGGRLILGPSLNVYAWKGHGRRRVSRLRD